MKLQYTYDDSKSLTLSILGLFLIILIPFGFVFAINKTISGENLFSISKVLIIFAIAFVIGYFRNIRKRSTNEKVRQEGFKIQGYITSVSKIRHTRKSLYYDYCLNVVFNNQNYVIHHLKNNNAYKRVEQILSTNYQQNNGQVIFNPITIDIYIKDNSFFADLDSVILN